MKSNPEIYASLHPLLDIIIYGLLLILLIVLVGLWVLCSFASHIVTVTKNQIKIMESQDTLQNAVAELTTATTEVGVKIDGFLDVIANGGATKDQEAEAIAGIKSATASLRAMGVANPTGEPGEDEEED